jgi:signal transduction histidine kinase
MQVGAGRAQSSVKSTGLGLYIAKKFAQLMDGDVVLEASKPNKGSTFAFSLPMG